MNHDVAGMLHGLPVSGVTMTALGVCGSIFSAAVKFTAEVPVVAQAGGPVSVIDWANVGSIVSGVCLVVGPALTFYLSRRNQYHIADIKKREREDAYAREKMVLDALAELKVENERRGEKLSRHLERQDVAIQQIANNAATTPGATPAP